MSALALMAYASGAARLQPREGAGAGILRAPGHADTGAHRPAVARRQHGSQPRDRAAARALTHNQPGLHALLALNNGIGAWYNSTMLYRGLRRQGVLTHAPGWKRACWLQSSRCDAPAMVRVPVVVRRRTTRVARACGAWQRAGRMGDLLVAGGAVVYFGTLLALGCACAISRRIRRLRTSRTAPQEGADDGTGPRHSITCGRVIAAAWLTIGNYDGVHRGHQHMIGAVRSGAREFWRAGDRAHLRADTARVFPGVACAGAADAAARKARSARPLRRGSDDRRALQRGDEPRSAPQLR